jgi:hypothetical protein
MDELVVTETISAICSRSMIEKRVNDHYQRTTARSELEVKFMFGAMDWEFVEIVF